MNYIFIVLFVLFTLLNIVTRQFGLLSTVLGLSVIILTKSYGLLWDFDNKIIVLLLFLPLGLFSFYLSLILCKLNLKVIGNYFAQTEPRITKSYEPH